tara:strand:- start:86 stop:454 length:369 start_codon:yes stop_codon:yes gene_type:complete
MTTYYNKYEIETAMKGIAADYLKNCIECEELSEDFVDLIKYNFLAKYVSLDKSKRIIEIGVEDTTALSSHYPVINIFSFPLDELENKWLDNSFKNEKEDLTFYGKLLNRKKYNHSNMEVVVL